MWVRLPPRALATPNFSCKRAGLANTGATSALLPCLSGHHGGSQRCQNNLPGAARGPIAAAAVPVRRAPDRRRAGGQRRRLRGARSVATGPASSRSAGTCSPPRRMPRTCCRRCSRPRTTRCSRTSARSMRGPGSTGSPATGASTTCAKPVADGRDSRTTRSTRNGAPTADVVHKRADLRHLIEDVHKLPETQRTALLLREIDDLSYEQIAETMDTTVPSVKSLLVRARMSLAEAAEARQLSCDDVRRELAEIAEGLHKITPPLRRHMRECDMCRSYRKELSRTSTAMALALPVGPFLILKKLALLKLGFAAFGGGAGGAGGATAGGGAAAGGLAAGGGAGAAGVPERARERPRSARRARHRWVQAPRASEPVRSRPRRWPGSRSRRSSPAARSRPRRSRPSSRSGSRRSPRWWRAKPVTQPTGGVSLGATPPVRSSRRRSRLPTSRRPTPLPLVQPARLAPPTPRPEPPARREATGATGTEGATGTDDSQRRARPAKPARAPMAVLLFRPRTRAAHRFPPELQPPRLRRRSSPPPSPTRKRAKRHRKRAVAGASSGATGPAAATAPATTP